MKVPTLVPYDPRPATWLGVRSLYGALCEECAEPVTSPEERDKILFPGEYLSKYLVIALDRWSEPQGHYTHPVNCRDRMQDKLDILFEYLDEEIPYGSLEYRRTGGQWLPFGSLDIDRLWLAQQTAPFSEINDKWRQTPSRQYWGPIASLVYEFKRSGGVLTATTLNQILSARARLDAPYRDWAGYQKKVRHEVLPWLLP